MMPDESFDKHFPKLLSSLDFKRLEKTEEGVLHGNPAGDPGMDQT